MKNNYLNFNLRTLGFICLLSASLFIANNIQAQTPTNAMLYNTGSSNSNFCFDNSRINTQTPVFRVAATDGSGFNSFGLEINTKSDFTGTPITQTFPGTYSSVTQYEVTFSTLTLASGTVYYVRARASADGGSTWSAWSTENTTPERFSFSYDASVTPIDWHLENSYQWMDTGYYISPDSGLLITANYITLGEGRSDPTYSEDFEADPYQDYDDQHAYMNIFTEDCAGNENYSSQHFDNSTTPQGVSSGSACLELVFDPSSIYQDGYCNDMEQGTMYGFGDYFNAGTTSSVVSFDFNYFNGGTPGSTDDGQVQLQVYQTDNLAYIISQFSNLINITDPAQLPVYTAGCTNTWASPHPMHVELPLVQDGGFSSNLWFIIYCTQGSSGPTVAAPHFTIDNIKIGTKDTATYVSPPVNYTSFVGATGWNKLHWTQTLNTGSVNINIQKSTDGGTTWANAITNINQTNSNDNADEYKEADISSLGNGASAPLIRSVITLNYITDSVPSISSFGVNTSSGSGPNTWLGNTTDWNLNTNWSSGSIPSCMDAEDLIPATSNNPVISVAENAGNLVINDGVTLTVNAALSVCGNLTGGTSTTATVGGTAALTLTGTALQTISGKLAFQNQLAVDNTLGSAPEAELAAGAAVNIYDALVLQNDNTFDASQGTLTLKSTSVTQAGIIDNFSGSNSGTVTGNITAERFYGSATASNDFKQHMLGSPVSGINLSALGSTNGSSAYYQAATGGSHNCNELLGQPGTPYGNVFSYDETHANLCTMDGWKIGAASTPVSAGSGYSVILGSGSGTISLTGTANLNSSYTPGTTNSDYANTTSDQGRSYPSGINLLSNPYPAALDVSTLNSTNSADFSGTTVYVWDVATGSYDMNPATIAPFQAFKVIQSAAGSSTYSIPGTARTTSSSTFQRTTNPVELNITVTNNSTGLADNTIVGFNTGSTAQFDPSYDVIKLPGALTRHTMYSLNSNYWLAINTLKSINETSTVPVGFEPGVSGTYTANFSGLSSFDPTSYIMLEDLQTGTMFNVRSGDYTFTSDATNDSWNRFILHFTPPASITASDATCSEQGMINIVQPGTAIWNYTLADNNNVTLSSGTLNVNSPLTASVPAGVYTLTLVDNNGYTVVKTIEVNGVQPVIASFTASANAVNVNQEVTLNSTSNNAVLNSWNFGDGATGTGATIAHAYVNQGVYNVTLNSTSASGCTSSVSNTITVTRSVTGVTDLNDINNILIWSNENIVNVDFSQLTDVQANIEMYNILGQKLSEDKYVTSSVYRKEIPNIEEGYIVVSVKNNDEVISKKLFISNVK